MLGKKVLKHCIINLVKVQLNHSQEKLMNVNHVKDKFGYILYIFKRISKLKKGS